MQKYEAISQHANNRNATPKSADIKARKITALSRKLENRPSLHIMQRLTDKEIRKALIPYLARRANAPLATIEEMHVCNGNAIADVVAVYKSMHCYEIKGETDSISRIIRQAEFFDQAFPLITLVTTENHANKAQETTPKHWGIIIASTTRKYEIGFKYLRGASRNKSYRPEIALLTLWRPELLEMRPTRTPINEKMNRQDIAIQIASSTPTEKLNELLGKTLAARRSNN